jgi:hypothetical protein
MINPSTKKEEHMGYTVPPTIPPSTRQAPWYTLISIIVHSSIIWRGIAILEWRATQRASFADWFPDQHLLLIGSIVITILCILTVAQSRSDRLIIITNSLYSVGMFVAFGLHVFIELDHYEILFMGMGPTPGKLIFLGFLIHLGYLGYRFSTPKR